MMATRLSLVRRTLPRFSGDDGRVQLAGPLVGRPDLTPGCAARSGPFRRSCNNRGRASAAPGLAKGRSMDPLAELRRVCGVVADDLTSCTHSPGGNVCSSCGSAAVRTLRRAARGAEHVEIHTPGVRTDAYLTRKA